MTNSLISNHNVSDNKADKNVLVPKGVTIGLGVFALILAVAWVGMSIWSWSKLNLDVVILLPKVLLLCTFFLVALPLGFVLGARAMNRYSANSPIQDRNALTLGLLFTCVTMLWLMGSYS